MGIFNGSCSWRNKGVERGLTQNVGMALKSKSKTKKNQKPYTHAFSTLFCMNVNDKQKKKKT